MTNKPEPNVEETVEQNQAKRDKVKQVLKVIGIGTAIGTVAYLLGGQRALYQIANNQQDTIDILLDRTSEEDELLELTD